MLGVGQALCLPSVERFPAAPADSHHPPAGGRLIDELERRGLLEALADLDRALLATDRPPPGAVCASAPLVEHHHPRRHPLPWISSRALGSVRYGEHYRRCAKRAFRATQRG